MSTALEAPRSAVLYDFIVAHSREISARARERVLARSSPSAIDTEHSLGVPILLAQLAEALRPAGSGADTQRGAIDASAALHGGSLLKMGVSIGQVVHTYGDVCQAVTELATLRSTKISTEEFQTLNMCLDNAIASAVTEYSRARADSIAAQETERRGTFTHELRNLIHSAMLSFDLIKRGTVGPRGSTSAVHDRSLARMSALVERSVVEVRLGSGIQSVEEVSVAELVDDVELAAVIRARNRGIQLHVGLVDPSALIAIDRITLESALANLLDNAFKFTHAHGRVALRTLVTATRVRFEIEDECGGLPSGSDVDLFRPFEQRSRDRSGLGLGLAICRRAVEVNRGELSVKSLPGKGCIFSVDLPRCTDAR